MSSPAEGIAVVVPASPCRCGRGDFLIGQVIATKEDCLLHSDPSCIVFLADLPGDEIVHWVRTGTLPGKRLLDLVQPIMRLLNVHAEISSDQLILKLPVNGDLRALRDALAAQLPLNYEHRLDAAERTATVSVRAVSQELS